MLGGMTRSIIVRTSFVTQHRWRKAKNFLKHPHRHVFHVAVEVSVTESDRELEFFAVQEQINKLARNQRWTYDEVHELSCEQFAEQILVFLRQTLPGGASRRFTVDVSEDGENTGRVSYQL